MSVIPRLPPPSVLTVALIFAANGLWQLVHKALPALAAGRPDALSEFVSVILLAVLVVGLVTLRPWARSTALWISAFSFLAASLLLGLLQQPDFAAGVRSGFPDVTPVVRFLTVMGGLALVSFLLLRSRSARRAFGLG